MKHVKTATALFLLACWQAPAVAAPDMTCQGEKIRKLFSSGALWEMCWTVKDQEGLVVSQVHYQPPGGEQRRVLGEASLAQIESIFDDSAVPALFVSTQRGLGGNNMLSLQQKDCPGGNLVSFGGRNVLCAATRQAGYLYKYNTQRQTQRFELSTSSQIGARNYTVRWAFYENGTMEPAVGFSGVLPAVGQSASQYGWLMGTNGEVASSFVDHYLWRLDFDLDTTAGDDLVEEINSIPSFDRLRKSKTVATIEEETSRSLNPETKRFWRIRDGEKRGDAVGYMSYELVPSSYDQSKINSQNRSWLADDVYFTRYNACERFAADNVQTGCTDNVSRYVNGQALANQDVVMWYKQNMHFLPRSEDSNRIGMDWNSFKLLPRDWNMQNPF